MWKRQFSSMALCLVLTGWLHAQWRLFSYDDGQPAYVDPHANAYVAVRFTPPLPLRVHGIHFMVFNTSNTIDGCHVWIEQTGDSGPTYLGYVPPPLPDKAWVKFNLSPARQMRASDFYVILQQPGGPVVGPGWWVALDNGTTTQRTRMCFDGQNWVDYTVADALIRVEATMDSPTRGDFGTAYGSFPSRLAQGGPCHLDVSQEWIGGPTSVTTVEDDALFADQDDEVAWCWVANPPDQARRKVFFGTQVSYNSMVSDPADERYLNILVDLNNNGQWDGDDEWPVRNFCFHFDPIPAGVNTMYLVDRAPDSIDPCQVPGKWARVTLSEAPVPDGTGAWGAFARGETEDFAFRAPRGGPRPLPPKLEGGARQKLQESTWRDILVCPHGWPGAETPRMQMEHIYNYGLTIPRDAVRADVSLEWIPSCGENGNPCTRLEWFELRTGGGVVVAEGCRAGPNWGSDLLGAPGWLMPGTHTLEGWAKFPVWTTVGHDDVAVYVLMWYDPAGDWVCARDREPLVMRYGSGEPGPGGGLVAHWTFDEGAGTTARDSSRGGADLTLHDITWEDGLLGSAVHFHGRGFGDAPRFTHSDNAVTVCAWVWHDSFRIGAVERYVTMSPEVAVIRKEADGRLHFFIQTDGTLKHLSVSGVLNEGQWHFIAGTWDGVNQRLYVDGEEIAHERSGGILNNASNVSVSSRDEPLNGKLDEARIYNRALSHAEILAQME